MLLFQTQRLTPDLKVIFVCLLRYRAVSLYSELQILANLFISAAMTFLHNYRYKYVTFSTMSFSVTTFLQMTKHSIFHGEVHFYSFVIHTEHSTSVF
jgi:hypothetical protein